MKKIVMATLLTAAALLATPVSQSGKAGDIDVKVKTEKDLFVGQNSFKIELSKDGKPFEAKAVKLKAFMPEMPGMPAMGEEVSAKGSNGVYNALATLSMRGTWQMTVTVAENDGKTKKYRFSINF
jgi:hypothetical protein